MSEGTDDGYGGRQPTSRERATARPWDDSYRGEEPAPWDVGRPQPAVVRLAGAPRPVVVEGDVELLTLSGSIGAGGSHLHLSVADARGRVVGGHAAYGCVVRTTAEVLLALAPGWAFAREADPATGWSELVVRRR